jgi:tetraacyldisaccharide 4'-kinase
MHYGEIRPVFETDSPKTREEVKKNKGPVLLLTGIANPRDLRKFARSISTSFYEMNFPDHHAYTSRDIEKIMDKISEINHPGLLILTTEKDAMRLQEIQMNNQLKEILYYVPIHVAFLNEDADEFNQIILNYVRNNKRNSILHKEQNQSSA